MITTLCTNTYKAASKIKPKRSKHTPILETIKVSGVEGRLALSAVKFEGDQWEIVTETVPARISESFETCVPGRPFVDWLRVTQEKPARHGIGRGESDQIILSLDPMLQILKITAGNTRAEFKCIDAQEFPTQTEGV